jgi:hypothetical protein
VRFFGDELQPHSYLSSDFMTSSETTGHMCNDIVKAHLRLLNRGKR